MANRVTDPALDTHIFQRRGGVRLVADACGITPAAVSQWRKSGRVPPGRVDAVAGALGVPACVFRRDAARNKAQ